MLRVLLIAALALIGIALAIELLMAAGAVVARLVALGLLAAIVGGTWAWRHRAAR